MDIDAHKRFLSRLRTLPTLPVVFHRIVETVENPDSSAEDLRRIVEKDQSVVASILRLANSAYFGYPRGIPDLSSAIVVLGFNTIRRIALSVSLLQALEGRQDDDFFTAENFWMHSVGVAAGAQHLAEAAGVEQPEQAYLAGLLHDIGKVILLNYFFAEYVQVVARLREQPGELWRIERAVLGFDHAALGGWLGERWQFPEYLISVLQCHHQVLEARERFRVLATAVQIADRYCYLNAFGLHGHCPVPPLDPAAARIILLNEPAENALVDFLKAEKAKAEVFFLSVT